MKKIIITFIIITMMMATVVFATGNETLEDTDKFTDDDLYLVEDYINVNGIVEGNVYVIGKNINIEGAGINGNVFAIGDNVTIKNTKISGSVYTIAGNLNFSGETSSMYALAQNSEFDENSKCTKNLKMLGTEIKFNGFVGKNFDTITEKLEIKENAVISGPLNYYSTNQAEISQGSNISEVNFKKIEKNDTETKVSTEKIINAYAVKILKIFVKTLLIAWILICGVNKFNNLKRTNNAVSDTFKNFAFGWITMFLLPLVSIILLCTGIGFGIGIIGLILYCLIIYFANAIVATDIAKRIKFSTENKVTRIISAGCIAIVINLVGYIPVIGGIINFIMFFAGLGIVWNLFFQKNEKLVA